jgi:colanic acid biosynthesis protein WcaH
MNISEAVQFLDNSIPDKKLGLPDDIFYFVSRVTPLVNVDLLIKDESGRTLLTWRDDEYGGKGWHIPGSIVRFKETLEQRVLKCAKQELGTIVTFDPKPVNIEQCIVPELDNRAHHISFLYQCYIPDNYVPNNKNKKKTDVGYIEWHERCPDNLIRVHDFYRRFIGQYVY